MRKIRTGILFAMLLFSTTAFAWVWLVAPVSRTVLWAATRYGPTMVSAAEASVWAHAGIVTALWWSTKDNPDADASKRKATVTIDLKPDSKRTNPDPVRYDNPASNKRDVTPKATYPLTNSNPVSPGGGYNRDYVDAMPGGGLAKYSIDSGTATLEVIVVQVKDTAPSLVECEAMRTGSDPGNGSSWTCPVSGSNGKYYGMWKKSYKITCAGGYTQSGSNCNMSDSTKVMKPAQTVCEVLRNADGTFDVDSKNPECAGLSASLSTSGRQMTMQRADGDKDVIESTADGGYQIKTRGPGGDRDITLGPWSDSAGGSPIKGTTDYAPGTAPSPGDTGGSSGSGSTGSGTGSCGGAGQTKCLIDDSGFEGKDSFISSKLGELDGKLGERDKQISDLTTQDDHGITKDWLPSLMPGPVVQCKPLTVSAGISHGPLSGLHAEEEINICDKLEILREIFAWLFGVGTVIYIYRVFTRSNGSAAA